MMAKVHLLLIGLAAIVLVVGLELMIWKNYPPSVRVKIYRYHFYAFIGRYDNTMNSSAMIVHYTMSSY